MNIVIVGASGPTGARLVERALAAKNSVTAVSRRGTDFAGVTNVSADVATDLDVVRGADAVISVLGVPFGNKPITAYSSGTSGLIAAMQKHGVRRLLVTSSSAADPAVRFKNSGGGVGMELMKPLVIFGFGRTTYADMRRMEAAVRASDLDWTIVRPSGLFDGGIVTNYTVAPDHVRGAFTSRTDLADFMVRQAKSDTWVGKTAAIATADGAPGVLEFMRAEAFG
jgi:nucleoside-diphosphate-sugar epimerase